MRGLVVALCVAFCHATNFRIEHRISTPDSDGEWLLRSYEEPLTAQKTSTTAIDKNVNTPLYGIPSDYYFSPRPSLAPFPPDPSYYLAVG
jgi:hypothetical protein